MCSIELTVYRYKEVFVAFKFICITFTFHSSTESDYLLRNRIRKMVYELANIARTAPSSLFRAVTLINFISQQNKFHLNRKPYRSALINCVSFLVGTGRRFYGGLTVISLHLMNRSKIELNR